jgi:hypothetical protein
MVLPMEQFRVFEILDVTFVAWFFLILLSGSDYCCVVFISFIFW